MSRVVYCGVCTMPPEYCRYHPKYDKCLAWMKDNLPDLFKKEIEDIEDRNPKIAKKCRHLWDDSAPQPEMKASNDEDNDDNTNQNKNQNQNLNQNQNQSQPKKSRKRGGKRNKNRGKNNNNNNNQNEQTKQVQIMESQVNYQQNVAEQNMNDIQGMLDKLSTSPSGSPSKGILKNKNPNYAQEQQNLNDSQLNSGDEEDEDGLDNLQYLGAAGNRNAARGPPSRKATKQKKRKKKNKRFRHKTNKDEDEEEDEEKKKQEEEEEETREQKQKRVKFEKMRNKKVPKNIVEVTLENRKGNKRVTIVRGFIEKSKDKEQRIKSEFMKKFATSCMITFQNQGSDKGPKQVVLMGDKRYDFMKYLKDKFPKAGKLLYYKTKRYGLTPAIDPDHGFIMPPP